MIMCISKQCAHFKWNHWSLLGKLCPLLWNKKLWECYYSKPGKVEQMEQSWSEQTQAWPEARLWQKVKYKDPSFRSSGQRELQALQDQEQTREFCSPLPRPNIPAPGYVLGKRELVSRPERFCQSAEAKAPNLHLAPITCLLWVSCASSLYCLRFWTHPVSSQREEGDEENHNWPLGLCSEVTLSFLPTSYQPKQVTPEFKR